MEKLIETPSGLSIEQEIAYRSELYASVIKKLGPRFGMIIARYLRRMHIAQSPWWNRGTVPDPNYEARGIYAEYRKQRELFIKTRKEIEPTLAQKYGIQLQNGSA